MKHAVLLAALAASLSLAACSKPAEQAAPVATAEAPVDTSASTVDSELSPAGMVGQFSGTLPCASCPGIDTRLTLAADGSFQMQETYREQDDGQFTSNGQWVMDEYDAIVLVPADGNEDGNRVFKAIDANTLRQQSDGVDAGELYTLRRD